MTALLSTTLVSLTVIAAATVAVCLGRIGSTEYVALVGAFGGGTGLLHVTAGGR